MRTNQPLSSRLRKTAYLGLLALLLVFSNLQTTELSAQSCGALKSVSLEERVSKSQVIIEGKVIEKQSFKDPATKRIMTAHLIEVYKVFKGSFSTGYATLVTDGGTVGNESTDLFPSFDVYINDVGIFCLNPENEKTPFGDKNIFRTYGYSQGFIRYNEGKDEAFDAFNTYKRVQETLYPRLSVNNNGKTFNIVAVRPGESEIISPLNVPTISHITPTLKGKGEQVMAGTISGFTPTTIAPDQTLTINGANFGTLTGPANVFFKSAFPNEAFIGRTSNIISWTATQIKVRVPFDVMTGLIIVKVSDGTQSQTSTNLTITIPTPVNPTVSGFTPTSGVVGDQITINGTGFQTFERPSAIFFTQQPTCPGCTDQVPATTDLQVATSDILSWTDTQIRVKVPANTVSGKVKIQNRTKGSVLTGNFTLVTPGTSGSMSLTSFTPTTANAGVGDEITINGAGFGATQGTVGFANADDGGTSKVFAGAPYITAWSATQIKVKVPTKAGTGSIVVKLADGSNQVVSVGTLTVTAALLTREFTNTAGVPQATFNNLIAKNGNGGYTFKASASFASNAAALGAFKRSLEAWRCTTGVNFRLDPIALTDNVCTINGSDLVNRVSFDANCQLSGTLLGLCIRNTSTCNETKTVVQELDLVFDAETNWNFTTSVPAANQLDFESVALHELGHAHQLGHVINTNSVMHFASRAGVKYALDATNISAANRAIDLSIASGSPACVAVPMTRLLAGECRIGAQGASDEPPMADFKVDKTSGCAPLTVSFTNLSMNEPEFFAWDINNDGITDYTDKDITHVFTQPGTYSVKLMVSNIFGDDQKTMYQLIVVQPNFNLTVSRENVTVCQGSMVSLEAWGATNYHWTPNMGTNNTGNKFSFTASNSVMITLTGSNGSCTQTKMINVNVVSNPMVGVTSTAPRNGNDGMITLNAMGGTPPYMYRLNDGMPQMSPNFMWLSSGTYMVYVTDANNCTGMNMVTLNNAPSCMSPTNLMTVNVARNNATVAWSKVASSMGYSVAYRAMGDAMWMSQTTFSNMISFERLSAGTMYEVKVRTMCNNMWSDYTSTLQFMTQTDPMCETPYTTVEGVKNNSAWIMWKSAMNPANGFMVAYRSAGMSSWMMKWTGSMSRNMMLDNLMPSTAYEVKVMADCGNNNMAESMTRMFSTLSASSVCMPVSGLWAETMMTEAQLHWSTVEGASSFMLYWKMRESKTWMSRVLAPEAEMFTITGLMPGRTYDVMMKTNCGMMSSDEAMTWFMTKSGRDGISATGTSESVAVYPNPNTGIFSIRFTGNEGDATRLVLRDITAKTVWTQNHTIVYGTNVVTVDGDRLPTGIYTLEIAGNNATRFVKVIVE